MIPALLITFREVIEATLIVATISGILVKLNQKKAVNTVWLATGAAALFSITLLIGGSLMGLKVHELYTGKTEEIFEGIMMVTSAIFISWAVFWLHSYFAQHKLALLQKVKQTIATHNRKGLFLLVFTAVFREGFEIVLFLSTIYLSTSPLDIISGFTIGAVLALIISGLVYSATLKMPIFRAFQLTSVLLILFAAGLGARGVHEFAEAGILPEFTQVTLAFLPQSGHIAAGFIKSLFGLTRKMDYLQLLVYAGYVTFMRWYLYGRKVKASKHI